MSVCKPGSKAYQVIIDTYCGHRVRVRPQCILHEIQSLLFQILTGIAEVLPIGLPTWHEVSQCLAEGRKVLLVRLNCLLCPLKLHLNPLHVLSLSSNLLGVRGYPKAIALILLTGLDNV